MSSPVDAQLIGQLLDRHGPALRLYAAQWTTSPDDCVQEALIELARQPATPESPVAWLFRVVRNRALNAARAARRRQTHEETASRLRKDRRAGGGGAQDAAGLRELLERLDESAREIVVLRIWGKLTWQEIANLAGGSSSSAQRNYEKALTVLRNYWEPSPCPKTNLCPTK